MPILGLTVTDFPLLRLMPGHMTDVLRENVANGWKDQPETADPTNWPEAMRSQWGDDRGEAHGNAVQQRLIHRTKAAKEAAHQLNPDVVVLLHRDVGSAFWAATRPTYWVQAHPHADCKMFEVPFSGGVLKDNYFGLDPDRVDRVPGDPGLALALVRGLQELGHEPTFTLEPTNPRGLGQNAIAGLVHLHWEAFERFIPTVPISFDPFGFLRTRTATGLSEWNRSAPRPLTPNEAFNLGRDIARMLATRGERIALVAAVDWSHANNTSVSRRPTHPDVEADLRRFDEWKGGLFDRWGGSWTFDEMELHAQWELLITIVLAGAMTELGATIDSADLITSFICNDDFVTTVFKPVG